jgi:subfamily B ATP-binding cassette protein MsbA
MKPWPARVRQGAVTTEKTQMRLTDKRNSRVLYLRLLSYVRPHARIFAIAILGMVATAATEPLFPALMKPLLDGGFRGGAAEPVFTPMLFSLALVGIFVLRGLFNFVASYCSAWVSNRVVLDLRAAMFARLIRFPASFFDERSSGALMSKIAYDVAGVTAAATSVLTVMVRDSLAVIGLLAWLFYINWKLTLVALAVFPLVSLVVRLFSRRLREMSRGAQEAMGNLSHVLQETIESHKVVKIFGGQEYESTRFKKANQQLRGYNMRQTVPAALTVPITQTLAATALAIIVYIGLQESLAQRATIGEFVSFVTAMLMMLAPLKHLTEISAPLQRGLAAAESVFGLIDEPAEADNGTTVLKRAQGGVTFEQVSFTYATRKEPALKGIDLVIAPGETVALVGGSGGGKTTLVNLLPRFYRPSSGRITLDGHDIETLTLESLRGNIALVSQEVVLFNDTIAANIAYGRLVKTSREAVIAAAEAAYAMDFISATPEGLDTLIGENGMRLSGGQRQRLAIARALLKDAPLLLLDEATSALDSESERQVQAALDVLMRGRTTLVIAHRLSTIERADRILVLDQGRIVESGRHEDLLAAGGNYARLYNTQYAAG